MKIRREKNIREKNKYIKLFDIYKKEYEKMKSKYNKNIINENEFKEWIIKQKNIKKVGDK